MARYTVSIQDHSGQRIGYITHPATPEYRRRKNQATAFSFGVLMADASLLDYGTHCTMYRDGNPVVAGRVIKRAIAGQLLRVECITHEALLRDHITPTNWNRWAGWVLSDAVADLLMDFVVQARNTPEDWAETVDKSNVDLTTWPGKVVLEKDASGRYKPSGYITLQFDFDSIAEYEAVRWAEDVGEDVRIKVQTRFSADGTTWAAWSDERESVFPDVDGVTLTGNARYIQVRLNLYTDDTTAEDQNGKPTGYTPVLNGVEVIARKPGLVFVGSIADTPDVKLATYRTEDFGEKYAYSRENALKLIQTWCEDYGYEFEVTHDLKLNFGEDLGATRNVVLRRTSNMEIKSLGDDADNLTNVLHCFGAGDGPAQIRTTLYDQESIAKYGERVGTFHDNQAETLEALVAAGNKQLTKSAWPQPQYMVHKVPVHELVEDIGLYDTIKIADPQLGTVTTARILDEERKLTTTGEDVSFGLNCSLDNIIERIVKGQITRPQIAVVTVPEAPHNMKATPGYGNIQLTWVGDGEAFIVEHSLDGNTFTRLDKTDYRHYLHTGLVEGSVHYYRVTTIARGMASSPSDIARASVSVVPEPETDTTPPAVPAGFTITAATDTQEHGYALTVVSLAWNPVFDDDLREFHIQRNDGVAWEPLAIVTGEPGIAGTYRDSNGLVVGSAYEYRVASADASGNRSAWSNPVSVVIPGDTTPPAKPSGLTGSFKHGDAMFRWDACSAPDFKRSKVEILTGGVVKRTTITANTSYDYTLEMNKADHAKPSTALTIRVTHEDFSGNTSDAAAFEIVHDPLPAPASPTVESIFSALWIELATVEDATGYYVYITSSDGKGNPLDGAATQQIRVGKVTTYTYQASPDSYFLVAASAFDELREGPRSTAVEASTSRLGVDALEPGSIKTHHIEAGSITEAQLNWATHLIF